MRYGFSEFTLNEKIGAIMLAFALLAYYVISSGAARAQQLQRVSGDGVVCHTAGTSNTGGVNQNFGSPSSFFSGNAPLLMSVLCGSSGVAITLGNGLSTTYVYKYGYLKEGVSWKRIQFEGNKNVGSWFVGSASYRTQGASDSSGAVLAYICENIRGTWKCGCKDERCTTPAWQRQEYRRSNADTADAVEMPTLGGLQNIFENSEEEVFDLYYANKYSVRPGDSITIEGAFLGTDNNNDVLWTESVIQKNVDSVGGRKLYITVPEIPVGKYELHVRSGSKTTPHNVTVWVVNPGAKAPKILRISPTVVQQGDTVTLYGENFISGENDVITTFSTLTGLTSPDGKTITFTYSPFEENLRFIGDDGSGHQPIQFTVPVIVANTNGISTTASFTLDL